MARKTNHGQAIVEVALLLPCFGLAVFMAVQLICFCHNMIELQRMAALDIERESLEHFETERNYYLFHSLFGHHGLTKMHAAKVIPQPWRPFRGKSVIKTPGRILSIHLENRLKPGRGFSQVLGRVTQSADAETLLETPLPKNGQ